MERSDLRRWNAYAAEAQRLSHTGTFGWKVATGELVWSEETFRIFAYDTTVTPTLELVLQRCHPDDAERVRGALVCGSADGDTFDLRHRLLLPDGSVRHLRIVASPFRDDAGEVEYVGAVTDVSEQHRDNAALQAANEDLSRSEDRLRLVVDTIPSMVWSAGPDGMMDFQSASWQAYHGHTLDELERGGWLAILHPDELGNGETWASAVATGGPYEIELRVKGTNGEYRWFLSRAVPLRDAQGRVVKWYGTVTDIEDRKRAEVLLAGEKRVLEMMARGDALRAVLEALCRLVEELTADALSSILLYDASAGTLHRGAAPSLPAAYSEAIDGAAIGPSAGSCGTAAYRAEAVVVVDIAADPLWADYRDLALRYDLRACWSTPILSTAGSVLGTFAIYHRTPRGPTPFSETVVARLTHVASIAVERERAEAARREQASLLDLTHDSIFVRDRHDVITYWNRGAEELYGWGRDQAVGRVSHDLMRTVFPTPIDDIRAMLLRAGRWEGELVHTKADGSRVVVASRWSLQRDAHGEPVATLEIDNDVTEHKRAEAALRNVEAELARVARVTTLGEVTASIAHEVNQPLAAIVNNASACLALLPDGQPDLDEMRDALGEIVSEGERAATVIQRVRALATKTPSAKASLCLRDVVDEVVGLARTESSSRGVTIRNEVAADLPPVVGDRVQLQQVLLNLVVNGMDAMRAAPEAARILVIGGRHDVHHDRPAATVTVRDYGAGLETAQVERLFDAFYTTKPNGMGMGLAISRSIVESHGGRLWCEPHPGAGTTFAFSVPAASIDDEPR
ncbi:MAG: PAS domain S-box protein [bacterium]|nr:PAS domain S-box protein [bacterium]